MSVQFGRCNFDGQPIDGDHLREVGSMIRAYAFDEASGYLSESVGMYFRGFPTTRESRERQQPFVSSSAVITWDGRLDNRAELARELETPAGPDTADVAIVAAAYEAWGNASFGKLLGDWAAVIWVPAQRVLILAKDFVGTRHLYYSIDNGGLSWNTILDPLVLLTKRQLTLNREYLAGCLAFWPASHLTPFVGISSVPPASYVAVESGQQTIRKYWEFNSRESIRYRSDREYEEHFRYVFRESVRRRLRSDSPILAELSGGMDSSSIVCMADTILSEGDTEVPRLDTVSYFDDAEPGWDDRRFFSVIEEKRGITGGHIDVGSFASFCVDFDGNTFSAAPVPPGYSTEFYHQLGALMHRRGNRVLLSGIGGDEVTGGVPTPIPELRDLFATVQWLRLARRLKAWALYDKRPLFHLFFEAVSGFLPVELVTASRQKRVAPWIRADFRKHHRAALAGYEVRRTLFGPLPSLQENLSALDKLRRHLAHEAPRPELLCEKRYPYLDRDLLEFLYAVPREQLVRPGQRRSLMRRALAGIVPDEILNRKRKAFVARAPRLGIAREWPTLVERSRHPVLGSLGIVEANEFSNALQKARIGTEVQLFSLLRTLGVEAWLSDLDRRGWLQHSRSAQEAATARKAPQASLTRACPMSSLSERR